MSAVIDECPFPTRQSLDRLSPVDRIRTWQTWLSTYPDAPAADRSTAGRIIDHAMKSYDLSDEDRRILRAEAQPARHGRGADGAARQASPAPAPAPAPPARPAPGNRPISRSPQPLHVRQNPNMSAVVESMGHQVTAAHSVPCAVAAAAPGRSVPQADEIGMYAFYELTGKPPNFETAVRTGVLPAPDRIDATGNRFWKRATAEKFRK